jgi:hypothetical protein
VSECDEPGDVHPHNPAAIRGPNRIWNEDALPITDWEVPEYRVVVPADLQSIIRLPVPVLRVSRNIHVKQITKHADTRVYYEQLSQILARWTHWRQKVNQSGAVVDEWEIVQFIREDEDVWPLLTAIGPDKSGSWNLITNHRKNDRFHRRILAGKAGFQRRVK